MGIHLGGVEITEANGIFLGGNAISEVFLGTIKVWPDTLAPVADPVTQYGQHYGLLYAYPKSVEVVGSTSTLRDWQMRTRRKVQPLGAWTQYSKTFAFSPESQRLTDRNNRSAGFTGYFPIATAGYNTWQLQSRTRTWALGATFSEWSPETPTEITVDPAPANFTLSLNASNQIVVTSGTIPVWDVVEEESNPHVTRAANVSAVDWTIASRAIAGPARFGPYPHEWYYFEDDEDPRDLSSSFVLASTSGLTYEIVAYWGFQFVSTNGRGRRYVVSGESLAKSITVP